MCLAINSLGDTRDTRSQPRRRAQGCAYPAVSYTANCTNEASIHETWGSSCIDELSGELNDPNSSLQVRNDNHIGKHLLQSKFFYDDILVKGQSGNDLDGLPQQEASKCSQQCTGSCCCECGTESARSASISTFVYEG